MKKYVVISIIVTGSIFFACDSEVEKGDRINTLLFLLAGKSSPKSISEFRFFNPAALGVINEEEQTINVAVPYGTDVAALYPTITYTGMYIIPPSGVSQDFTNPVTYTITAEDGSTKEYSVAVSIAPNSAKEITKFVFNDPVATGDIDETNHTIAVTVPYGTNVAYLVPTITHTGSSISPASGTARSFTSPVTYTVTAEDASTRNYTVTVTVAQNSSKSITGFRFSSPDVSGKIDETSHTIYVIVPHETNVASLVPTITHTGASISPLSGVAQNFTSPVTYTVRAVDNSTRNYTVRVSDTVALIYNKGTGNTGGDVPTAQLQYPAYELAAILGNNKNLVGPHIRDGIKQRFVKWNTKPDGSGADHYPGEKIMLTDNMYLYAIYTTGNDVLRKVGPGGGWVFYDAGSQKNWGRYLEAANADFTTSFWGSYDYLVSGAWGSEVGTGARNTEAIVFNDPLADKAADKCMDYTVIVDGTAYSDWFLPSSNELDWMYKNLYKAGVANLKGYGYTYWSSTQADRYQAWYLSFYNGSQGLDSKLHVSRSVRAIREFPLSIIIIK